MLFFTILNGQNKTKQIGSPGHAVVPCIHKALQEWAQYSLNTVTYIMKGINSLTEMYSALCAEIPIATDPSTSLDIRTIAKLDMADKVYMNISL